MTTKKAIAAQERETALTKLREWMPKDSTVYTVLRHRSASGMRREIGIVIIHDDVQAKKRAELNKTLAGSVILLQPNYSAAIVLDATRGKHDGIIQNGCGMDMGFNLVYNLAAALYGDGYALRHEWI